MDIGKVLKNGWRRGNVPGQYHRNGGKQSKSEVNIQKVRGAIRSDFDKERLRLKEKEDRRHNYSKYIYELALPNELDRQELKKEAAR